MNNNELMHYGILGMKWGRRRYQNLDGSLTALGRAHYGVGEYADNPLRKRDPKYKALKQKAAEEEAEVEKVIKERYDSGKFVQEMVEYNLAKSFKDLEYLDKKYYDQAKSFVEKYSSEKKDDLDEIPVTTQISSKKKDLSEMTDDEINTAIARKQLEDRYNQAINPTSKTDSKSTDETSSRSNKSPSEMTEQELRDAINRNKLEREYAMSRVDPNNKTGGAGKAIGDFVKKYGAMAAGAAVEASIDVGKKYVERELKKKLEIDDTALPKDIAKLSGDQLDRYVSEESKRRYIASVINGKTTVSYDSIKPSKQSVVNSTINEIQKVTQEMYLKDLKDGKIKINLEALKVANQLAGSNNGGGNNGVSEKKKKK